MSIVVDYAWTHPSISTLRNVGAVGVVRYLSNDSSKNLSSHEYSILKDAGLSVTLVWETTGSRALSGYAGGQSDADRAEKLADALGYPDTAAIYFTADFDANSTQRKTITQYLKGARDSCNRPIGIYGSFYVVEDAASQDTADYFWQTQAWSGGQVSKNADLLQVVKGSTSVYDINYTYHADWGQDNKSHTLYPPFPLSHGHVFGDNDVTSGHNLHLWQKRMNDRGWSLTVDDIYGPETKHIAEQFQNEKNLVVDGLIGPHTWNAAWIAPVT